MSATDANGLPVKSRRKKLEVPVHDNGHRRTFSANFNAASFPEKSAHTEIIVEIPDADRGSRTGKRQLRKENLRLSLENQEVLARFHELEELSVKKIVKLRDKVTALQAINASLEKENCEVRRHLDELLEQHEEANRLLGQQKEVNRQLLGQYEEANRLLELSKCCKGCESLKEEVEMRSKENGLLKEKDVELSEDLKMLKTVVYRLNVQLERYQEILRKNSLTVPKYSQSDVTLDRDVSDTSLVNISREILSEVHRTHKHTPLTWGSANRHALGPLLDAYEDTVKEKEEIIQNYDSEMIKFTGRLKEIISENECLHRKLTEDEGCSSKLKVEVENLRAELKATKDQNDVLIKKCSIKQDRVEEVLKVYEAKVEQMKRDFEVLHREFMRCRTENAAIKEKNKSLTDAQEEFRTQIHNFIPLSLHNSSVNECKKWYEELKVQYENEKAKLLKNIESHSKLIEELNKDIVLHKGARDTLELKTVQMEEHIKKLESKIAELDRALTDVQTSRGALKKQLHKAMIFAKDMVAEQETLLKAVNQRQLETKAVKKIGCDMAAKMDFLKNQLKDVQKSAWHEFTTVEQTIQEQADTIETLQEDHVRQVENLKKVIKEHEETIAILKKDQQMSHYLLFKDKK
ncbi:unnamed protein product [Phaedon cochleariae]|uniref:Uncharacterized protein n=1 Tax=Phaedon cochleariae TaxID=80249 RepID=A0A9P0DSS3_PHACE|nr:unnamed protein product [Phaedon cochleariae]